MPMSSQTLSNKPRSLEERLFIALDVPSGKEAVALAARLAPLGVSFKVGMELFYQEGPAILQALSPLGRTVFVDLKLHDIPNTVAGAVASLVRNGACFMNVHTLGGKDMMRAAVQSAENTARRMGIPRPVLIGVTILTSHSEESLKTDWAFSQMPLSEYALHLAKQAQESGLDGVVCSAQEAGMIQAACGSDFLRVTPGIRPAGSDEQDQARLMTPCRALRNGATYLVVGRPVVQAADPVGAAKAILAEMQDFQAAGSP